MTTSESIRVAVIGDPHFYTSKDGARTAVSHILVSPKGEFLNSKPQQNPWSDLKDLLEKDSVNADVLLCVGDITYGADRVGLATAWKELNELALQLNCKALVTATGNHDIMSRSTAEKVGLNPTRELSASLGLFEPLKLLEPAYPVVEIRGGKPIGNRTLRTKYFGDSIALFETAEYRIIVLNSCCEHGADAYQYERGSFPRSAQEALIEDLSLSVAPKINILVCHHPPEPHSEHGLGGHDFIENGETLMKNLELHGSWLVVHGHKHHGRITYGKGTSSSPIIFAASSLGMQLDTSVDGMRNQFYCLDVNMTATGRLVGTVEAWDWYMGVGWMRSVPKKDGIYDGCGFGPRAHVEDIALAISKLIPCTWGRAVQEMPDLKYLTPDEMKILERRLAISHGIVVEASDNGYWSLLAQGIK
ncbi:metallophosphoesterase family protein [Massilia sp. GER05]|uniref:metallophosphoesterase family protein n=1 Tax=Massilia sp. GER05 TaxID=3394605 RepID=UPI003F82B746